MKVLITGASGRLGRALRRRLEGHPELDLTCLISPRSIPLNSSDVSLDITDFAALSEVIRSTAPDAIIHLAGLHGAACAAHPAHTQAVNVTATQVLRDAAAAAGTSRVVFTSTAAVYGDSRMHPLSEDELADPQAPYGHSKHEAEKLFQEKDPERPFTAITLRIFNIYGEGFIDSLIYRLRTSTATSPVHLQGLDTFVRDYVHCDDVIEAIFLAVINPASEDMTINIGSGQPVSNRQLVQYLSATGTIYYKVGDNHRSYSCADIRRARKFLGYAPSRFLAPSLDIPLLPVSVNRQ